MSYDNASFLSQPYPLMSTLWKADEIKVPLGTRSCIMNLVTLNLTENKTSAPWQSLFSGMASALARLTGLDPISRAERTLSQMPDELLADMGIKRSEIADAVRFGRGDESRTVAQAKIIELRRPSVRPDGGPDVPRAA
jgi:uncharacterized protein YjiS (DUF1127 family)